MTTPETGHPLLQALIDSISVFDGAACWDFAAMYAVRDALVAAQAAPAAQPVSPTAWMWQHPETGHTGFVENCTEEERRHWERVNRPRVFVCPLYASPQAAQPVAWQPIETAPMSGRGERPRWFLAYNGHHIGVCARWADEGYGETIADELDEVVVPPPTRWMPLPPPPQADTQPSADL